MCPERRAPEDTSHSLASSQQARLHLGTQPQHKAGLHAPQLAKPTRSHAQHHAATTTTTTATATKLQRHHPRKHHPSRNNADATTTTRLRATRQNTRQTPRTSRVLKHDNAHAASKRTSAAENAQHTPPTHAGASSPCSSLSPAPTRRPPTQAAKAAISKINHHHNKPRNDNNNTHTRTHTQTRWLVVVVVASSSAA
jgi:hypothetical protein